MTVTREARIVAAVDGSESAVRAAGWAARTAGQRAVGLKLVHAYVVPTHGTSEFRAWFPELREGMREQGRQWLVEARAAAERAAPGVSVETALAEGEPVSVLLDESRRAGAVVLAARGLGGFTGMLVGSVAVALSAHGHSPVVVVRGQGQDDPPPTQGPVVVGADGSPSSVAALEFAHIEAAARGVRLVAVRTWSDVPLDGTAQRHPLTLDPARVDAEERETLEDETAAWRRRYPDVPIETVVARGRPVRELLGRSVEAQLLVVGGRGRGGFTGMLLGSTSRSLVLHAHCPVGVVRGHEPEKI